MTTFTRTEHRPEGAPLNRPDPATITAAHPSGATASAHAWPWEEGAVQIKLRRIVGELVGVKNET